MLPVLGRGRWGEGEQLVHFQGSGLSAAIKAGMGQAVAAGRDSWPSLGSGHRLPAIPLGSASDYTT